MPFEGYSQISHLFSPHFHGNEIKSDLGCVIFCSAHISKSIYAIFTKLGTLTNPDVYMCLLRVRVRYDFTFFHGNETKSDIGCGTFVSLLSQELFMLASPNLVTY